MAAVLPAAIERSAPPPVPSADARCISLRKQMPRVAVLLRRAWADVPRWARWVLVVYLIGFADGTADHVRWMTRGGIHAYASSYPPVAARVFFVSLVVLDPLVVVLVAFVRREGIWLLGH
jgi:hypothetical protein